MEIAGRAKQDHPAVDALAVVAGGILVHAAGDCDAWVAFQEDLREVRDDYGVGVEQEDARVQIECPGMDLEFFEGYDPIGRRVLHYRRLFDWRKCLPAHGNYLVQCLSMIGIQASAEEFAVFHRGIWIRAHLPLVHLGYRHEFFVDVCKMNTCFPFQVLGLEEYVSNYRAV